MKIGELASATGVNPKTIRYYEDIGVLPPSRRASNGYRVFAEEAVERLRFIKDAQSAGLTLSEIGSVLGLREQGASTCRHVLDLLSSHRGELDSRIAALEETRAELDRMIERARRLDPAECRDPNRCQAISQRTSHPPRSRGPTAHHH